MAKKVKVGVRINKDDLLPGNWIYGAYSLDLVQFKCLSYHEHDSGQINCHIDTVDGDSRFWEIIRPIPITHEYLELANWSRWTHQDKAWMDDRSMFQIEQAGEMWALYSYCEADGTRWFLRNLEYLHELQNTCYFVDRHHLEFNLKNPAPRRGVTKD